MRYRFTKVFTVSGMMMALATGCGKKPPAAADAVAATTAPATTAATKAPEDVAAAPTDTAAAAAPEATEAPAEEVAGAAGADGYAAGEPDAAPAEEVAAATGPAPVWTLEGFALPESVYFDAEADVYYVANINGTDVAAKDDNGFISKVGADGKLIELKWIDGASDKVTLNAPKGMAVVNGTLWVADIDRVQGFDLKTGAPTAEVALAGATFANDVVALPGATAADPVCLLVTDSGIKLGANGPEDTKTAAIWKVCDKEATKVAEGEAIGHPNGITVIDGKVAFVGFDATKRIAFKDAKYADLEPIALPVSQLDGIAAGADGVILVSSWEDGSVFKVFADKHFEAVVKGLKGPADFAFDAKRKVVVVPQLPDNKLSAYAL